MLANRGGLFPRGGREVKPVMFTRALTSFVLATVIGGSPASAHPAYQRFVFHEITVAVRERYVDFDVRLVYRALAGCSVRQIIDTNRDGRIGSDELSRYGASLAESLADRFVFTLGPLRLPFVPLYAPRIDLLGTQTTGPAPLVVHLSYFVRLPEGFAPPAEARFTDLAESHRPAIYHIRTAADEPDRVAFYAPNGGKPVVDVHGRSVRIRWSQARVAQADRHAEDASRPVGPPKAPKRHARRAVVYPVGASGVILAAAAGWLATRRRRRHRDWRDVTDEYRRV